MKYFLAVITLVVAAILPFSLYAQSTDENPLAALQQDDSVTMSHIHGLGFSADGRQLFVPAHSGFRIYQDGEWIVPELPSHDYMGYSPTDEGFYSSGHPGGFPDTGHPGFENALPNPLGLVKSEDNGQTLITLAFAGESDFHLMAVGYESHAVYVVNAHPNSELEVGLFYTLDDSTTWEQADAQGIDSRVFQVAVHPTEENVIALATETGLFLSDNYGDEFQLISEAFPATAVAFDTQTGDLYFGYQTLYQYNLQTVEIEVLDIPEVEENDGLAYIAFSPATEHVALAYFSLNIYLSTDKGQTWEQIADAGRGISAIN